MSDLLDRVRIFRNICEQYEFAEKGTGESLLITETLKNLALNFRFSLPRVVSLGAKGAGKTFIYVQLSRFKHWESFLQVALKDTVNTITHIFPFLQSKNLGDTAKDIVRVAREGIRIALGDDVPEFLHSDYETRIKQSLSEDLDELGWTQFWINEIARSIGILVVEGSDISLQEINHYLKERQIRIVLLFDGLEDIFQEAASEEKQKLALRLCRT